MLVSQKGYRRGYPVAILVGLKEDQAVLWKIFSHIAKQEKILNFVGSRNDSRAGYNFHESIISELRPSIREGVRSIVISSPPRTPYSTDFQNHIKGHHAWLFQGSNKVTFAELTGSATTNAEVTQLTRTAAFRRVIGETTIEETENLLELLEKQLNSPHDEPMVLYSLEEIEDKIYNSWNKNKPKPNYLLITDSYMSTSRQKNRVQRLIQISTNKGIKTRIIPAATSAGKRLMQFGGLICILQ